MQINKPYTNIQYADLAIYCNEHNCHIEDKGDYLETVENVPYVPTDEEQRQNRANAYALELDPLMTEYLRKKMFKLFKDGEEETLINSINAKISEIKTLYPYSQAEDEGGGNLGEYK